MALREVPGVPPEAVAAMAADLGTVGAAPCRDEAETEAPIAPDHEILFPDREIEIEGVKVTIREYTFAEGLKIAYSHRALLADLAGLFLPSPSGGGVGGEGGYLAASVELADLQAVLGANADKVLDLVALATGRSVEWIAELSDVDGQELLLTWWTCNKAFFGRRLAAAAVSRALDKTLVLGGSLRA